MTGDRLFRPRVDVRPRFRCLVCHVFVTGGDDGSCPRCGWHPPGLGPPLPRRRAPTVRTWLLVVALLATVTLALQNLS